MSFLRVTSTFRPATHTTLRTRANSTMSQQSHLLASNVFTCKGLTAVVTGGGTGIGLMQTLALAQNGAKVYITSRNEAKLNDVATKYKSSGEIIPIVGDITSKDGIAKIVEQIQSKSPNGINVLFNNAGIAGEGSREGYEKSEDVEKYSQQLLRSEFKEWEDILKTNVTAHYFTAASFLPLLKKGGDHTEGYTSQIVNTTSISGLLKGSSGGQFAYASSKASMVQMTKVMASEFLHLKIRVNQIAPGIFPSEMTAGASDAHSHKSDLSDTEKGKGLPAGRPGHEVDMAAATLYLASYGGVFCNGQALWPDGGATVASPSSI